MFQYTYHNLTTHQRTTDPAVALLWWKRGDWLRTERKEED